MQFSDILRLLLATAVAAILIIAAVSDIRTRRIPNWTVVSLLALFVLWTALGRGIVITCEVKFPGQEYEPWIRCAGQGEGVQ